MKRIFLFLGGLIFWLLWPVWLIYFRVSSQRSRVMVMHDGKILLVRDWLGRAKWGLPGGGAKKSEDIKVAACRELHEELGLQISPDQLEPAGDYIHKEYGLSFQAHFFVLRLDHKPVLNLRWYEMAEARWFSYKELTGLRITWDARYAIDQSSLVLKML